MSVQIKYYVCFQIFQCRSCFVELHMLIHLSPWKHTGEMMKCVCWSWNKLVWCFLSLSSVKICQEKASCLYQILMGYGFVWFKIVSFPLVFSSCWQKFCKQQRQGFFVVVASMFKILDTFSSIAGIKMLRGFSQICKWLEKQWGFWTSGIYI